MIATARVTAALRMVRKVGVTLVGVSLLAVAVAMIVLPGPAILVAPLALGILATEFAWARRLLRRLRDGTNRMLRRPCKEKMEA